MDEQNPREYRGEEDYYNRDKVQPRPFWRRHLWPIVAIVALILVVIFGTTTLLLLINRPQSFIVTPQATQSRPTPILTPPLTPTLPATLTSSPTLTITPTPTPSPGTVFCDTTKPGQGWDTWNLIPGWKILHGELLYDGTGNGEKLVAPSFCQPTTPNYAVDVKMRIVSQCCHFGIIVRGDASTSGSTGYQVSIYTTTFQNLFISTLGGGGGATTGYSFDNNFHIWRAEVKDNVINFVIDGGKVLSLTDNTYLVPGEVSICCTDSMQLDISSFKITAL